MYFHDKAFTVRIAGNISLHMGAGIENVIARLKGVGQIVRKRNVRMADEPCIGRNAFKFGAFHEEILSFAVNRFTFHSTMRDSDAVGAIGNDVFTTDPA